MSVCMSPRGEWLNTAPAERYSVKAMGEARGHWTHRHLTQPSARVPDSGSGRDPGHSGRLLEQPPGSRSAVSDDLRTLDEFLDDVYVSQERLTSADLQRSAIAADLPATVLTKIDALPEGEYAQDEAAEALRTLP
jgi:hypothetical protein